MACYARCTTYSVKRARWRSVPFTLGKISPAPARRALPNRKKVIGSTGQVSAVQLPICQNHVRVTARVTQFTFFMKCRKSQGSIG
jgi:hypothetical protein